MRVLAPGIEKHSEPILPEARSVMARLTRWTQLFSRAFWFEGVLSGILLLCCLPLARAHTGPPTPILVDHMIGPYLVSLWAHPEVGTGTFFIRLEPPLGGEIKNDVTAHVGIQPLSRRLVSETHLRRLSHAARS